MSFTTPAFFAFFVAYYVISYFLPQRAWLVLAAVASSFFYAFWDWRFLFLLYYVITVSWFVGQRIARATSDVERRRWVMLSVVSCLGVLLIFKYFNFFTDSFGQMMAAFGLALQPRFAQVLLPIGISFYTFHALSYTIDLYRRKLAAPADFLSLTVYLAFFPQLVAGPIVRAHRFLPQIYRGPIYSARKIKLGLLLIAWGYFLKVCVADNIAIVIDAIFDTPSYFESGNLIFGIVGYSFQIYGDFAGYSLIAIGLAKLQGFDFPANFLAPYFSRSFSEFWQRWHISLSSFLRDYLYIPLGGNRHGRLQEYRNVMITMFLGGLWHGASYNFIIWGVLHGLYLVVQRLWHDAKRSFHIPSFLHGWIGTALSVAFVYALTLLAWIFFRIHTLHDAIVYIEGIAHFRQPTYITNKFYAIKVVLFIAITLAVDFVFIRRRNVVRLLHTNVAYGFAVAALLATIEFLGAFGGGAFIYFQF
jgi:D-alanyl-lipoteichoic acid acyltransferase DltB (MBOAT superfamily)